MAGSRESVERLQRMFEAQRLTKSKLEDNGSSLGFIEGTPIKSAGEQPIGAQGEFGQAARDPAAGDYFGEWLARMSNFERNVNPDSFDQGAA